MAKAAAKVTKVKRPVVDAKPAKAADVEAQFAEADAKAQPDLTPEQEAQTMIVARAAGVGF